MRATRYKQLRDQAQSLLSTDDGDRFIDFGIRFHIVRKDSAGVVPVGTSLPKLARVREPHTIGGRYDTLTGKFVGPCEHWREWLIGEKQFAILFNHPTRHALLYSAEGAGKTTLMAMWSICQIVLAAIAGLSGTLGATAPTATRLDTYISGVCDLAPFSSSRSEIAGAWGTLLLDKQEIIFRTGHRIQFRSTKRQSHATGSPLQGYNFGLGIGMDELQDSTDAFPDAVARLRSAPGAPIMATATAKDSPAWRSFRDSLDPEDWTVHRLRYTDTPFVHDSHWAMMQRNLSAREWQRRGLAMDVGPERAVYTSWDHQQNVGAVPDIGAEDVTERVLARYGHKCRALVGTDPGKSKHVSTILKAYQVKGERRHRWYVVGECTTERGTHEQHILDLRQELHKIGCDPVRDYGQPVLKFDPTTKQDVFTLYRRAGLIARPAAYKTGSNKPQTIPKESRIDMLNRLFCNASGETWLYLATDDQNRLKAPKTCDSIELSERDAAYEAENVRKGDNDTTHWSVSLGYALWSEEKPRIEGGPIGRVNS